MRKVSRHLGSHHANGTQRLCASKTLEQLWQLLTAGFTSLPISVGIYLVTALLFMSLSVK